MGLCLPPLDGFLVKSLSVGFTTLSVQEISQLDVDGCDSFSHGVVVGVFGSPFDLGQGEFSVVAQDQSDGRIECFAGIVEVDIGEIQGLLQREGGAWGGNDTPEDHCWAAAKGGFLWMIYDEHKRETRS